MRRTALPLALFGALLVGRGAEAQTGEVVDEATMMVARDGAPIGRESFRIIRSAGAGGQAFRAVATSGQGDLRLSSALTTDSSGTPLTYELRVSRVGEQVEYLQGRGRPDRFSVLVQTRSGEAAREYLVTGPTVLLDDVLFHQFYFVARAARAARDSTVAVISPREGSQGQHRLVFKGAEPLSIGGRSLSSRHFALVEGSDTRAEVWIDSAGRLLKASVPGKALVALRDDPPR